MGACIEKSASIPLPSSRTDFSSCLQVAELWSVAGLDNICGLFSSSFSDPHEEPVFLPSRPNTLRLREEGRATTAPLGKVVGICMLALCVISSTGGCAVFGRHRQSDQQIAAARELSRQGVAALETGQP